MKSPSFIGLSSDDPRQSPRDDDICAAPGGIPVCRIAVRGGRVSRAAARPTLRHGKLASKPLAAAKAPVLAWLGVRNPCRSISHGFILEPPELAKSLLVGDRTYTI
jgi:hypothetical protein